MQISEQMVFQTEKTESKEVLRPERTGSVQKNNKFSMAGG